MLLTWCRPSPLDSPGHAPPAGHPRTVNEFVARVSEELERRGHEVVAIAAGDPVKTLSAPSQLDIVHVHDRSRRSVSSAALRHSFSLNVATFHAPQERVLSTQVARPLVEIFFGRLDARTVSAPATAELLERYFPAPRAGRARRRRPRLGAGRRRARGDLPCASPPAATTRRATRRCASGSPAAR